MIMSRIESTAADPEIRQIEPRKLVGMRETMSLTVDKTFELFRSFGPRTKEIQDRVSSNTYCARIYRGGIDMESFTPNTVFEKWAAVEVSNFENVPAGLEPLIIPAGAYAVFVHKGPASTFFQTSEPLFRKWLETSDFELDERPHFEILGVGYRPDNQDAEEEIWFPVRTRAPTR